jgi:hypothetical protein
LVCFRLLPSCPFRLLHTCLSPGPRGITPAFGYGAPHPSARGTSTLLSKTRCSAHTTQPSDSPPACMLDSWLMAFSNRLAATSATGTDGVSRFSRVEFPCMPGVSDCAESVGCSRCRTRRYCLPPCGTTSALRSRLFRSSIPSLHVPLSTLRWQPHGWPCMTRGQDGSLILSCMVGIELECADFRQRVTSPALSVTEWVPSSAMATSLQAPLRSRTVGFPESGSDLGSPTHRAFPIVVELKCSVHVHAPIHWFAMRARSCWEDGLSSALCPRTILERPSAQSPFAQRRFRSVGEMSCTSSKGITPSS